MSTRPRDEDHAEAVAEARAEAWRHTTTADQDYYGGIQEDRYEKYMGW